MSKIYDLIIIGGGPGGLTAAIYSSREDIETLVLEKELCGGLAASTDLVENYPGFPEGISGMDLMLKFNQQAKRFGTEIAEFKEVKKVEPKDGLIKILTDGEEYTSKAVIVASGSVPKSLNVPGEDELRGKGVSYCATCDGPLFKNKDVAVVGCGNSGLQEGEALLRYVKSVTFIEFLPSMTAQKILQKRVKENQKASFLLNHALTSIKGKELIESVIVKDRSSGKEKEVPIQGLFIYAGYIPNSSCLLGVVDLDKYGYIVTSQNMQTSCPGIYAVGDIRSKNIRQIDTACAEATIAAISVRDYLQESS